MSHHYKESYIMFTAVQARQEENKDFDELIEKIVKDSRTREATFTCTSGVWYYKKIEDLFRERGFVILRKPINTYCHYNLENEIQVNFSWDRDAVDYKDISADADFRKGL